LEEVEEEKVNVVVIICPANKSKFERQLCHESAGWLLREDNGIQQHRTIIK